VIGGSWNCLTRRAPGVRPHACTSTVTPSAHEWGFLSIARTRWHLPAHARQGPRPRGASTAGRRGTDLHWTPRSEGGQATRPVVAVTWSPLGSAFRYWSPGGRCNSSRGPRAVEAVLRTTLAKASAQRLATPVLQRQLAGSGVVGRKPAQTTLSAR